MTPAKIRRTQISEAEYQLLQQLRDRSPAQNPPKRRLSIGDRIADQVATTMGSWRFIIIQSAVLTLWITLNVIALMAHWDPYPFILLNLMLSFQAAYSAPFIMMSQNRQSAVDRQDARHDYEVNMKAELEIEHLQDKMNMLRELDIVELQRMIIAQGQQLSHLEQLLHSTVLGPTANNDRMGG